MTNTAKKIEPSTQIDTASYASATEAIRAEARRLLAAGEVTAVIGYRAGRRNGTAQPAIVTDPEQAAGLVFTPACVNNLALYLTKAKKDVPKKGKVAIVVRGAT